MSKQETWNIKGSTKRSAKGVLEDTIRYIRRKSKDSDDRASTSKKKTVKVDEEPENRVPSIIL